MYELNKKQKKGETIDTCVNAVIDEAKLWVREMKT